MSFNGEPSQIFENKDRECITVQYFRITSGSKNKIFYFTPRNGEYEKIVSFGVGCFATGCL